jgi:hypothetical protein
VETGALFLSEKDADDARYMLRVLYPNDYAAIAARINLGREHNDARRVTVAQVYNTLTATRVA